MNDYNVFVLKNVTIPEYHVSLQPDNTGNFQEQLDNLAAKFEDMIYELGLKVKNLVFAKIFLSDYINQKYYIENHTKFNYFLNTCAISMIEQAPLDGTKINMLLYFVQTNDIIINKQDDAYLIRIEDNLHIYQNITQYDKKAESPYEQTKDAFSRHIRLLSDKKMTLRDNCVRTWLYSRDVDKDYGKIVKARNDVFEKEGLTANTHFIASTGIEGKGYLTQSNVNIDFYSIENISENQIQYLQALDYLNNTYEYGVAFERGTCITYPDKKHIFISGTASIDKEGNCIYQNDVIKQTERLFLNIKMLLKDANAELKDIAQMTVYLRNISDHEPISNYLAANYGKVPRIIVLGRVCRPEWLIEIECMAVKSIT